MPDAAERPLLNPFPFAAETYFRFGFLVIVAFVTATAAGLLVPLALTADVAPITACFEASGAHLDLDDLGLMAAGYASSLHRLRDCLAATPGGGLLFWPGLLVAALLAGTAAVFLADPWIKRRRHRLVPMPPAARDLVLPRLTALAAAMGLPALPALAFMPLRAGADAFVFGRDGAPALALSQGAVLLAARAPASFDVLLAHELAHVANRDLTVHRLTRSVGAALFCVVLPLYLALTLTEPAEPLHLVANELGRAAMIGLVVLLARNAVSRSRERYADLRASLVPGIGPALDSLLASRAEPPAWRLPFATSPAPSRRRRGLVATDDLFAPQLGTAFAFGFALSLALMVLMMVGTIAVADRLAALFVRLQEGSGGGGLLAAGLWGPTNLVVAIFATALAPIVWRTSHAEALTGRRARGALQTAAGVTLGAAAGGFGALVGGPELQGFGADGVRLGDAPQRLLLAGASFGFLFLVLLGYFAWLRRAALAWTPRLIRRPNGRRLVLPLSLAVALPLAVLLPPTLFTSLSAVFLGGKIAATGQAAALVPALWIAPIGLLAMHPLTPAMIAVACLLPLAAVLVPARDPAGWFLLRGTIEPPPVPRFSIGPAMAAGAAIGGAAALWLHPGAGAARLVTGPFNPYTVVAAIALPVGAAALAGAMVARVMAFEHGMLAAFVALALIAAGDILSYGLGIGLTTVAPVANYGFGFALVGALVGAVMRSLLLRLLSREPRGAPESVNQDMV